jgi:2-polyprenyl-6-hydroxyphenyl methylase/3-demethylubiquinone-9 3-methyltransferase
MCDRGATVTGIDLSDKALSVARLHLLESGRTVDYRKIAAEELAAQEGCSYDVVTCMEMLEHVPDPASSVAACAALVKPGGHVFFSTINRNPKAYLLAVIGAEYVLQMLPRGTHDYARFIKPSELLALGKGCRSRSGRFAGNDLQSLYRTICPRPRYRRQLPPAHREECLKPYCSTWMGPLPIRHQI